MTVALFAIKQYTLLAMVALLAYALGRRLTRRIDYHSWTEQAALCTALGLGTLSYLVFVLGVLHLIYTSAVLAALGSIAIGCAPVWSELRHIRMPAPRSWITPLLATLVAGYFSLLALYPPHQFDATTYHLPLAQLYARSHALVYTDNIRCAWLPQLNEMLFTLALLLRSDILAQLLQWLMLTLLALAIYAAGARWFTPRAGLWGVALWLASPLVVWTGTSAYADIGATLFVATGVYAFVAWWQSGSDRWLALAALLLGMSAAAKFWGLAFVAIAGLLVVVRTMRARAPGKLAIFALLAALTAAPWYARAGITQEILCIPSRGLAG